MLTKTPNAFAPYSTKAIRISPKRRCVGGGWKPASAKLTVRRIKRNGRTACRVIARTPGGWADKESNNTRG